MTEALNKETIRDLIEARMPFDRVKNIISGYKDEDRFDKYVEVLQEKMPWKERILLPLTDELYILVALPCPNLLSTSLQDCITLWVLKRIFKTALPQYRFAY